jgi:hypothetical protein
MRWGDLMGDDDGVKVPDFDLLTLDNEKRAISLDFTGREAALIAVSFTCVPLDLLISRR